MSYFLEIVDAHGDTSPPTGMPDFSKLIPILSMSYGIEKTITHSAYEATASHPEPHKLTITKKACTQSGNIMLHTSQRKTKTIRIYATESVGSSALGSISTSLSNLNIKTVYEFGSAHLLMFRGEGLTGGGDAIETIRADFSKLSIRIISGTSSSTHGYDLKKGKEIV